MKNISNIPNCLKKTLINFMKRFFNSNKIKFVNTCLQSLPIPSYCPLNERIRANRHYILFESVLRESLGLYGPDSGLITASKGLPGRTSDTPGKGPFTMSAHLILIARRGLCFRMNLLRLAHTRFLLV